MRLKGKAIKMGDDINTDIIIPGRFLEIADSKELSLHTMEDLDNDFEALKAVLRRVQPA